MTEPNRSKPRKSRKKPSLDQKEAARMAVANGYSYGMVAKLVGITENEVMKAIRDVPDEEFQEMIRMTSRGLLLRSYMKAMAAIESITDEDLRASSASQKAAVAASLIERAVDKLLPTSQVRKEEHPATLSDVDKIMARVQETYASLQVQANVSLTAEKNTAEFGVPGRVDHGLRTEAEIHPGDIPGVETGTKAPPSR